MLCEALSGSTTGDFFRVCHYTLNHRFSLFWRVGCQFQPSERIYSSKPGNALKAFPGFWYALLPLPSGQ